MVGDNDTVNFTITSQDKDQQGRTEKEQVDAIRNTTGNNFKNVNITYDTNESVVLTKKDIVEMKLKKLHENSVTMNKADFIKKFQK